MSDPSDEFYQDSPAPITKAVTPQPRPAVNTAPVNFGRTLPFSDEAEQHVLACCLLDGEATLNRCQELRVTAESFHLPANRVIWTTINRLHAQKKPVSLEVLAEELSADGTLQPVGGLQYLMQVTGKIPTTAHATYFIDKLLQLAGKRKVIDRATALVEHAYNGTELPELIQDAKVWIDGMSGNAAAPARKATLEKLQSRRVHKLSPPPEPVTRLFLAGKPIATPGNIQTLIARAKQGKTATTGGAAAAIVAAHYDRQGLDCLGFTAPHTKEAVVLIDTEQSPYDAWTCLDRLLARAQQPVEPDWLCHYAFVGMSVADKKAAFILALEEAKKAHGGIFMVILDGVAHFVSSVNDEVECNEVSIWIRALSIEYNCPIMCIIHSNEGIKSGDDGRGHLGKQLTRDAESNLLLKKVGEITTITSEKQRKAPITESDNVAFKWDDTAGRHVSCTQLTKPTKEGRPSNYHFQEVAHIFPKYPVNPLFDPKPILFREAFNLCNQLNGISETSFRRMMGDAMKTGEVIRLQSEKCEGFLYHLPPV